MPVTSVANGAGSGSVGIKRQLMDVTDTHTQANSTHDDRYDRTT